MKRVDHSKGTDVDGFLQAFAEDRNEIWVTQSGDLQNVIDELIDRLGNQREQIAQEIEAVRKRFARYLEAQSPSDRDNGSIGLAAYDSAAAIARGKTG